MLAGTSLRTDQREFLTLIQQSADSLLRLLNDILDFSKIEAGRLELESIEFPLADCVGKAIQLLTLRAADKGVELACRIDPTIPDQLVGDPGRLRQIIVNLVGNAIKFTEQGEVVVNVQSAATTGAAGPTSAAVSQLLKGQIRLHISVRDTGIGIPQDKLDRLFKAFSQADASTTRKYGGTGLGLVISARLVEMMQGRIWVESQQGLGTTFHFTAELGVAAQQKPRAPAELFHLRGLNVLVVDDNSTNRRIMRELLTTWGMNPVLAPDGPSALREVAEAHRRAQPFKLYLLDFNMPGMDGIALAERLHALPEWEPCPMIMLSSSVSGQNSDKLKSIGISRFLTKPIIASELLEIILNELGVVAAKVVAADQKQRPQVEPRRILLVEDSPINQKVALGFLTKWGHQVVVADNGRKGVEAFEREPFDLILMDVQMPEMNGYDATAAIRGQEKPGDDRHPDYCHDGRGPEGRSRTLPGRRHGRLHLQADRPRSVVPRGGRLPGSRADRGGSAAPVSRPRHRDQRSRR